MFHGRATRPPADLLRWADQSRDTIFNISESIIISVLLIPLPLNASAMSLAVMYSSPLLDRLASAKTTSVTSESICILSPSIDNRPTRRLVAKPEPSARLSGRWAKWNQDAGYRDLENSFGLNMF
jgi:hypothetical protein